MVTERPPAEDELLFDDEGDDADGAGQLALPLEIDLDPTVVGESTPTRSGEQVARFVAESQPLGSDGRIVPEPGDDDPTVAFAPLDPDSRDAHSTVRLRRLPPALPPALRPPEPTPKVLLGPDLSTRNEITERVPLIPKTHPMANSIAPGGSALSMTPAPKRSSRGLFATGAVALLALGVGAAFYLRSPGEHHAATERDNGVAPGSLHAPHAAAMPVSADVGHDERAAPEPAAAPTARQVVVAAPQAAPPKRDVPTRAEPAPADPSAPAQAASTNEPPLRLEVGNAALRPGERPFRPSLAALTAAVDGVRDQVRACAGDAHGIADVVLRVQSTGQITHVLVQSGPFADSPAGSCIARSLRKAKVAPFRKSVAHILYTIRL